MISSTNIFFAIITLFLTLKKVTVDTAKKMVRIDHRIFWFFKLKYEVSFDRIKRIEYSYFSIPKSFSLFQRSDEIDVYTVSLDLMDGKTKKLWSFVGDGSVTTGWRGVILGSDSIVDYHGNQEKKARRFVDVICEMTGKGLVR